MPEMTILRRRWRVAAAENGESPPLRGGDVGRNADDGLLLELRLGGGAFSLALRALLRFQLLALAFCLLSLTLGERYLRSTQS